MAVKNTLVGSSLSMKYKEGIDANGKDVIKTKKFSGLKVTATDENIYAISAAFAPLMKYPVLESVRSNDSVLTNI